MKRLFFLFVLIFLLMTFAGVSNANVTFDIYDNYGPYDVNPDWTELWIPDNQVLGIEILDYYKGSFGFYFSTEPSKLIEIFGTEDQDLTYEDNDLSNDGSNPQQASIDFESGIVWDLDEVIEEKKIQSKFENLETSIGFYWSGPIFGGITLYTQKSLNGNQSFVIPRPSLTVLNTYLLQFVTGETGDIPFDWNIVSGISPAPVPEPSTMLLLGVGLVGLWGFRKKFRK